MDNRIIEQLNSFLRGEIAAVQTYRQAIDKVKDQEARGELEDCFRSHEERVQVLKERIEQMGGVPSVDSGPWGSFAKLVEGGAKLLGDESAIAAIEEGEDHGLADYQRDLGKLDTDTVRFVIEELLPAQQQTHATVSALKHRLH